MSGHIVPIHLIGSVSPGDIERLAIHMTQAEARRGGKPQAGEPALQDVSLACSLPAPNVEGHSVLDLVATGRVAGGGEVKCRFQVEVRFVEGRQRPVDDPGSIEVIKELAWPPVRDAIHSLGHMLSASAEMRMTQRPRVGLLDRLRWWAARRAAAASR